MHDAVAAATLLDDRFIQWKTADADIETVDPKTSGRVLLTPKEGGGSFRYADSVDLAAYKRIFAGMRLRRRTWIGIVLLATALVCFLVLPVRSRGLTRISDTGSREYTNRIATAVNVYARKGVAPSVKYTRGTFNGKRYDALIVTPSDTTFIQLDYAGDDPQYLDSLEDTALLAQGYWRVGGINGASSTTMNRTTDARPARCWSTASGSCGAEKN